MKKLIFCVIVFFYSFLSNNAAAQSNLVKPTISIGIIVEDLAKSVDFYTKVVGMINVRDFVVDADKASRMGLSNNQRFDIKVFKLENTENATELKLMSFNKKTNHSRQKFLPDENGIRYLTIFVKSLQPILQRIESYSSKKLVTTPTMLDEKRQFVLIQDPDGNFIEFISEN